MKQQSFYTYLFITGVFNNQPSKTPVKAVNFFNKYIYNKKNRYSPVFFLFLRIFNMLYFISHEIMQKNTDICRCFFTFLLYAQQTHHLSWTETIHNQIYIFVWLLQFHLKYPCPLTKIIHNLFCPHNLKSLSVAQTRAP